MLSQELGEAWATVTARSYSTAWVYELHGSFVATRGYGKYPYGKYRHLRNEHRAHMKISKTNQSKNLEVTERER